jgi:hypothetical protein
MEGDGLSSKPRALCFGGRLKRDFHLLGSTSGYAHAYITVIASLSHLSLVFQIRPNFHC